MVDEFGDEKRNQYYKDKCEWCEFNNAINLYPREYSISVAVEKEHFTMMTCSNGHVWSVWNGGERSIPFEQM